MDHSSTTGIWPAQSPAALSLHKTKIMRVTKTKMFTEVNASEIYLVEGQGGYKRIAYGIFVFLLYMGDLEIYLFFPLVFFKYCLIKFH